MKKVKQIPLESAYQYYAFISYKRADSKWADWLCRMLQSYRLPNKLYKQHRDTAKRLCPVFLDKAELIPGNLDEMLKKHIARSKYFVSVCSRNSQINPQYIDLELQYFLETHDGDYTKVIPFIVDDSPTPEVDCFSPGMQKLCAEHQLIGVNVHEKGKHRAFLKVIARMHGLMVSEIQSADDVRRRKNAVAAALAGVLLIGLGLFGADYWWKHYAVHTEYYAGYVWEYNVARGVGEIDEKELDDYGRYYRIESVDNRVRSISYHNYAGLLAPPETDDTVLSLGAARIEFAYSGEREKKLYTATYYDENSLPIACYRYSGDGTRITLQQDEESGIAAYVSADIGTQSSDSVSSVRSLVTRYVQELDADGRIIKRSYAYGEDFRPLSDGQGIFGYELSYDENGHLAKVTYFSSADGTVRKNNNGFASIAYEYENNLLTGVRYLDAEDQPALGPGGWAETEYTWTPRLQITRTAYKDADGNPVVAAGGYASSVKEFDRGIATRISFFDIDGNPTACADGYASVSLKVNEVGRIVGYRYFDTEGNPVASLSDGIYGYDIIETDQWNYFNVYVDKDDQPMMTADGYAYLYVTRDEYNHVLRHEYRDTDNKLRTGRFASCTYVYDDVYHECIEWHLFDENGQPFLDPEIGFASVIQTRDSSGFTTRMEFRGEENELIIGKDGYAIVEASRVLDGSMTTETYMYYDADGTPVIHPALQACGIKCTRYETGKLADAEYLDENRQLYYNPAKGFAGVEYRYDEFGYRCYAGYYGEMMQDIMVDKFSKNFTTYDKHGNLLQTTYYRLGAKDDAYASMTETLTFDGNKVEVELNYFDERGLPMFVESLGYARELTEYENGEPTSTTYFALEDGEYIIAVNEVEGCAVKMFSYDENGNRVEVRYLGADLQPMNHLQSKVAVVKHQYDEAGEVVKTEVWRVIGGELVQVQ